MSATLNDSAISPWEKGIRLTHHIPATDKELQEFEELSYELAKISSQVLCGNKTRPAKKSTLNIDAGRMI